MLRKTGATFVTGVSTRDLAFCLAAHARNRARCAVYHVPLTWATEHCAGHRRFGAEERSVTTAQFPRHPWHGLSPAVARALRPNVDDIAREMADAIRQEVNGYRQPLDSDVGRDVAEAVHRAVRQFVELIENPHSPQDEASAVFRRLGRLEYLTGRGMVGLQSAYLVGARIGCRRYVAVSQAADLPAETVLPLADAVLAHVAELARESMRGYLEAQARAGGPVQARRRELAERLLADTGDTTGADAAVESLAAEAMWTLPASIAYLVVPAPDNWALPHLDDDVLVLPRGGDLHLLVPRPDAPGRVERLARALRGQVAVLGPTVPLAELRVSVQCARMVLRHAQGRPFDAREMVLAADHLADLHLRRGARIGRLLADRTLGALSGMPAGRAARLVETLDAWLTSRGRTAPEVARALGIHPQTARYRLRQLEELFGDRLDDPEFRWEAQVALRTRALPDR